ncbi:MAG TPA: bile acid:sodium symporter family protein [Saprospiraceae bacterium]|nr:bile acid:sodium symporter family protein [Saprospiraceae bacterium]HMP24134.1 bile acid:sodium symporter family protein [Saprospiraceae bacterium]
METIDSVRINFNPDQLIILNLCLAFIMFGVALDLKPGNFRELLRQPKAAIVGLSSQLLLLPLLTLGLVALFQPPPSLALGMLLVSVCPGGNVSNFAVHLGGGNVALSVLLTSVSTLAATITMPLLFILLMPLVPGGKLFRQSVEVPLWDMVWTIVQLILVPLFVGMFVNSRFPRFTAAIRKPVRLLSLLIFAGFVVVAVMSNFEHLQRYLHLIFFIVLVHNAVALFSGYGLALLNRLSRYDARAIALETGIQNSGLALIIIFNFYNGLGGMAIIAAWWGVWHLISAASVAFLWNRRKLAVGIE